MSDRTLSRFVDDVLHEVGNARARFPGANLNGIALMEEVGELAKAMLDESPERVYAEAVQVACMAARVALDGDASTDEYRARGGLEPIHGNPAPRQSPGSEIPPQANPPSGNPPSKNPASEI